MLRASPQHGPLPAALWEMHGTADPTVPYRAVEMVAQLKKGKLGEVFAFLCLHQILYGGS
jgi:hypothetical protein